MHKRFKVARTTLKGRGVFGENISKKKIQHCNITFKNSISIGKVGRKINNVNELFKIYTKEHTPRGDLYIFVRGECVQCTLRTHKYRNCTRRETRGHTVIECYVKLTKDISVIILLNVKGRVKFYSEREKPNNYCFDIVLSVLTEFVSNRCRLCIRGHVKKMSDADFPLRKKPKSEWTLFFDVKRSVYIFVKFFFKVEYINNATGIMAIFLVVTVRNKVCTISEKKVIKVTVHRIALAALRTRTRGMAGRSLNESLIQYDVR
jgi:hypothetical protein